MRSDTPESRRGSAKRECDREDNEVSRRQFLAGVGGAVAMAPAAGALEASALPDPQRDYSRGATYGEAQIGREGYQLLGREERAQQQQGNSISFNKRVNAVKEIGCDPNGNEPIQDKVSSAAEDGTKIVFPPGNYLVTDEVNIGVGGTFALVGKGFSNATQPPKPGGNSVVFKIQTEQPINFLNVNALQQGQFGNFVIDQREPLSHGGVQIRSRGNVRVRDIRTVGAQTATGADNNPGFFTPRAKGGDSMIVYERCIARGGGIPGSKNIGGSPGFSVFGRNGKRGSVFIKDCVIENMADNGIYGARTTAKVRVLGGLYRNNDVSQVRVNGDALVRGVDVVIDEKNYTGIKTKSNALEQGPGWPTTNGVKIETKASISANTGTPVKNCNIVGKSVADVSKAGALVHIWDSGGAVTVDNCRITNNTSETMSVYAENPGSGNYPAAPKPWTTTVKNSVIKGSAAGKGNPAINIKGRPRSIVKNTCLSYANAGTDDIQGAKTSGVSFGKQCKDAGLSNPSNVSSTGNMSSLGTADVSYGGAAGPGGVGGASEQYKSDVKNRYRSLIVSIGGAMLGFVVFLAAAIIGAIKVFSDG